MIPRIALLPAILGALALGAALPGPAAAQSQAATQSPFEVTAVAYRELPPGLPIRVQLLDDSDLNLQVRELIVEQLVGAGHEVADDADFVLQVETEVTADQESDPSLGSFEAGTSGAELRMNLWSSREDSLLQGRQGDVARASIYRISMGVYDGRDGRYYWRGSIGSLLDQGNAAGASRDIVPALLTHFSKTAREAPTAE